MSQSPKKRPKKSTKSTKESSTALQLVLLNNLLTFSDQGILFARQQKGTLEIAIINDRLCELFGITRRQLIGKPIRAWVEHLQNLINPAETDSQFLSRVEHIPEADQIDEFMLRDERARSFSQLHTHALDIDGQPYGALFLYRDITHSKHIEDQAVHTQKMQSVGTLAGGIAHDFNNILTTILGYSSSLESDIQDNPEAQKKLNQITHATHRAAELTRNLLAFSRKNPYLPQVLNFNALVRDTSTMLSFAMPEAIHLHINLGEDIPSVKADPTQLQQVITHLVTNARDAIYGEGDIRVSTRIATDPQAQSDQGAGQYVVLDVEDNGIGIPKENLSRIFEPFFSNKETNQGIGLGLAMVYGTIKQHSGYVEVESAPNMGSRFSIHLPASSSESVEPPPKSITPPPELPLSDKPTVLVIDDEKDLRDLCQMALSDICKSVLVACDGAEGISVFLQYKDTIDLIILDLTMPRMDGLECLEELKKVDPNVKVIISSGYSQDMEGDGMKLEGVIKFLSKPYTMKTLRTTVSKILTDILND